MASTARQVEILVTGESKVVVHANSHPTLIFQPSDAQYDQYAPTCEKYESETKTYGLVGLLTMSFGKYLFYVHARKHVGTIQHHKIFQILNGGYVTVFRRAHLNLTEEQREQETLERILEILRSGLLHYSYTYLLTLSHQQVHLPHHPKEHDAFPNDCWWNYRMMLPFLTSSHKTALAPYILPMMAGYVGSISLSLPCRSCMHSSSSHASTNTIESSPQLPSLSLSLATPQVHPPPLSFLSESGPTNSRHNHHEQNDLKSHDLTLVSRFSRHRVGTRFLRRGVDLDGHCAIHVNSEWIFACRDYGRTGSFLMSRASVPLRWTQVPSGWCEGRRSWYKGSIKILDLLTQAPSTAADPTQLHFEDLQTHYPHIVCLNLLNDTGEEGRLSAAFKERVKVLASQARAVLRDAHGSSEILPVPTTGSGVIHQSKTLMVLSKDLNSNCPTDSNSTTVRSPLDEIAMLVCRARPLGSSHFIAQQESHDSTTATTAPIRVLSRQNCLLRVNCLDCIDRTSIGMFAVSAVDLVTLLTDVRGYAKSVTPPTTDATSEPVMKGCRVHESHLICFLGKAQFDEVLSMWLESSDCISLQYTGSPAVRCDALESRLWHRVYFRLRDTTSTLTRLFMNHFSDLNCQEMFDAFLHCNQSDDDKEMAAYEQRVKGRLHFVTSATTTPLATTLLLFFLHHFLPIDVRKWPQFIVVVLFTAGVVVAGYCGANIYQIMLTPRVHLIQ